LSGQTLVYPSSGDAQTPENLALQWLIENVEFQYTAASELPVQKIWIVQTYALLTLYAHCDGDNWRWSFDTWLDAGPDECDWDGVECTSKDLGGDIATVNVVTGIELFANDLVGNLPSDLGLLTHLESFVVSSNKLTGTLPATIGQWSQLSKFDVSFNYGLTGINSMNIAFTDMTGGIPDAVCNTVTSVTACFECTCCTQTLCI
jgi:hypothetical protein